MKQIPLLIIALSLALNLHSLAADSLWGDEIFTASFAARSPAEVIRWTADDIHPPLYYLLAGTFTRLTVTRPPSPASDWLWRFPSAVAATLTVAIAYRLAAIFANRRVAMTAAFLLALAPVGIKYGQEARMHALFMCLSALSAWFFFRAIRQPRAHKRWLALGLVTAANIYTMYFGFLIAATQGLTLLAAKRYRSFTRLAGFAGAMSLAGLLYLPWWPVLWRILQKRAAVGAIEGGVGHPLAFMRGVVRALGPPPEPVAWGFLGLFCLGLLLLARKRWPLALFAGLWLALPAAVPILLGDPRALHFRYAFALPIYLPVVSYAVSWLSGSRKGVHLYLVWLLATLSFIGTLTIYGQVKPDWRGAAAYLEAHAAPGDIILVGPLWDEGRFIGYYYRGQAQLLTPAALVANIEQRVEALRSGGGRIWAVNRFAPTESAAMQNIALSGVVISEPTLPVYEPEPVRTAALGLAAEAVEAAHDWAAEAEAGGILTPDPRTARVAALRGLGDTLMAAGRPTEAAAIYEEAVELFPGWVSGLLALAESYEASGDLPAAVKAYRRAVAFNPQWQGAEAAEAAALADRGDWPAALEKYRRLTGQQ